jgi:hypothetical protein
MVSKSIAGNEMNCAPPYDIVSKVDALKELMDMRFKASEGAVLIAQGVQDRALATALSASEKAISKTEHIQNDLCKLIIEIQKDIILLREGHSHLSGNGTGKEKLYGWVLAALMALATLYMGFRSGR